MYHQFGQSGDQFPGVTGIAAGKEKEQSQAEPAGQNESEFDPFAGKQSAEKTADAHADGRNAQQHGKFPFTGIQNKFGIQDSQGLDHHADRTEKRIAENRDP